MSTMEIREHAWNQNRNQVCKLIEDPLKNTIQQKIETQNIYNLQGKVWDILEAQIYWAIYITLLFQCKEQLNPPRRGREVKYGNKNNNKQIHVTNRKRNLRQG